MCYNRIIFSTVHIFADIGERKIARKYEQHKHFYLHSMSQNEHVNISENNTLNWLYYTNLATGTPA